MQTMDTQPARGAQPPQQPGAAPSSSEGTGGQLPQQGLSPDQVRKMQTMAKQAMGFLLQGDHADQIVARAKQGDPKQVVADTVLTLMQRLYEAATQAGQQIDMVTLAVTGIQIIGDLTEMLVSAGVLPDDKQAQLDFIAQVSKIAVDQHNAGVQQGGGAPQQGGAQ